MVTACMMIIIESAVFAQSVDRPRSVFKRLLEVSNLCTAPADNLEVNRKFFDRQLQPACSRNAVLTQLNKGTSISVSNIEELYSAINDPANNGMTINVASGLYMLSALAPGGEPRPNGGRLELQMNMSLFGVIGNREAAVIDATNLPQSSYQTATVPNTGALRMGRGTNAVEWLTIRNAVNGTAGIETDLSFAGTSIVRIAHIVSSGHQRGIDVRSFGMAMAGRSIQAEIVDNDLYNNAIGMGQGIRFLNSDFADGAVITATLTGNRSHNNLWGLIVSNNSVILASNSVTSLSDRFYENGLGAQIGGGLSTGAAAIPTNGNTTNFTAIGTSFENNNGVNNFDLGGILILGGANLTLPDRTSNNTVNATLLSCRFGNNRDLDIAVFGARSDPESIGTPGTGNVVNLFMRGNSPKFRSELFTDSVPQFSMSNNIVKLTGIRN